jgi:Predicted transcriptional regulators
MASFQVTSTLSRLGRDIQIARKRRRMSVADFCKRIGVTDKTLAKLERGDGGVRLETFAMALLALGLLDRLSEIVDPASDGIGMGLDRERLPERIRSRKPKDGTTTPGGQVSAADRPVYDVDDEGTAF